MANYNLVVNSTFQPFSFERYIQPYQMYGEAYKEVENTLADLNTKASVWEGMANEQTDPQTYAMYKKYADDLKNQANLLASKGLTPGSRKTLLDMKSRYSKEITPIEEAYTKRQKLIDEQKEALLRDNTLIFDKDYRTASLDDIIKNPNASYTPLSGKDIATRTVAMAKEAGAAILSDPEYSSVFNSQYVQQKIMQGYDMSQILAAAQRDPNAPAALLGIVDTIKEQVGYGNWDEKSQAKIDKYINEGLSAAAGTPKIDVMANRNYMSEMDRERLDLTKEQFEWEKEQALGVKQPDGSYYKPLGGGRILHTKPDGTTEIIGAPADDKETIKKQQDLDKMLSSVVKVSDMKGTGYTPVGAVIKSNGNWIGGREGEDIPDSWKGTARTNLKEESAGWHRFYDPMSWFTGSGDFSYTPYDSNAEASVVTNPETIPGFLEYLNGAEDISNTAFGQILEQARKAGISDEEFMSNNVQIVKVKAKGKRVSSDEPYDYLIYRKS